MINGIEGFSKVQIDNICLNIFVQALTDGVKNREQLRGAGAISQKKYMVGKTDKLFSMIVKFNTDTTFQDFAKNT